MSKNQLLNELIQEIRDALKFLAQNGCQGYDPLPESVQILETWTQTRSNHQIETLEEIRDDLGDCRRCELCKTRTHIVFGEGNPEARLVFVGEGPGYDEDLQGKPFVGKAGQLLTKIIKAMNLDRDQVYICNIIKCRPPQNRNPESDEIKACLPFLKRQLAAVAPEFICALGSVAIRSLMGQELFISRIRGRFFDYKGIKVMPTYHPAYLLRNPDKKRDVWEDVQKIMKKMETS
ncbi:MAG: uracil-DNA glycosylase [Desulfobacterales bacterium]